MPSFKTKYSFHDRKAEFARMATKHPDRLPIIIERVETKNSETLPQIDKNKYLVPKDLSVGQFVFLIRKRIKLEQDKALFVLFNNKLIPQSELIQQIYDVNKDEDGFLYATYMSEATFGVILL